MTNDEALAPEPNDGDLDLRLLPWDAPEGKPCFLSSADSRGVMSRYADSVEAAQMTIGADVLADVEELLADPAACCRRLRPALQQAADALSDVLRVAESRGARLPAPDPDEPGPDSGERGRLLALELTATLTALPHPAE
ncbi:hypothetical protein AF335_03450 [Streptomyces eurocidicus]|uniref:Uncharacterized protein n=1 Tax=Streptomyces eurocidicus TaxID=66423 RepID=A0A2N8P315_STREU|nr:hypothetical protein [Streptomyces eurocidicus]MBB5117579.1 hypothetical protein [Streptomyces eurocidicus]MBF6053419.1 hypothetical protein [Streptomyces eurocidicus]PNE35406.1 hypothetical protein AF335_03450 [Streptomyces eurocidicus]